VSTSTACPTCGSAARAGSEWCTLCFADLRLALVPAPPAPVAAPTRAADPVLDGAAAADVACTVCGEPAPVTASRCPTCGCGVLDGLRAPAPSLRVPGIGDLMQLSKPVRFGVAAGGSLVLATVLVLLLAVVGRLL